MSVLKSNRAGAYRVHQGQPGRCGFLISFQNIWSMRKKTTDSTEKFDPENYIVDTAYLARCFEAFSESYLNGAISGRHVNRLAEEGHLPRHRVKGVVVEGRWNLKHCCNDYLVYEQVPRERSGYWRSWLWVRVEIATALNCTIQVIPVLVDGAFMPRSGDLPDDLKLLARRNALVVNHDNFDADFRRLVTAIKQGFGKGNEERKETEQQAGDAYDRPRVERLKAQAHPDDEEQRRDRAVIEVFISYASWRNIRVIPVLVDGALMPRSAIFPMTWSYWFVEMLWTLLIIVSVRILGRLVAALERVLEKADAERRQ
jgi:hypothetical protein